MSSWRRRRLATNHVTPLARSRPAPREAQGDQASLLALALVSASPGGMAPGGIAPGGTMPGRIAPGGTMPGRIAPGGMAPGGMAPGGIPPGGIAPGGIAPGGIAPGGTMPGPIAPGGIAPGGIGPLRKGPPERIPGGGWRGSAPGKPSGPEGREKEGAGAWGVPMPGGRLGRGLGWGSGEEIPSGCQILTGSGGRFEGFNGATLGGLGGAFASGGAVLAGSSTLAGAGLAFGSGVAPAGGVVSAAGAWAAPAGLGDADPDGVGEGGVAGAGLLPWAATGPEPSPAPRTNNKAKAWLRHVSAGIVFITVVTPQSPGIIEDFRLHIQRLGRRAPAALALVFPCPSIPFLPFPTPAGG